MDDELVGILENNIDLALAHGYKMTRNFCLQDKNGHYMPAEESNKSCHPLESVVLGQKINGPINIEVAICLGVHPAWVDGCLDGYAGNNYDESYHRLYHNDPLRKRYQEGFDDGHELEKWIESFRSANMEG